MSNLDEMLMAEISAEFEALDEIELGSEEHTATVDGLAKLMDRKIELQKLENEKLEKAEALESEKKDRVVRNILNGLGIVVPTAVTIWGTMKSLKFEETGCVTTIMGRGFIQKLLPKK